MKSLAVGEHIKQTFAINCRFGKSNLYLSNQSLMIENSKGILLDLDYFCILSMQPIKKRQLKIIWREENCTYDFNFDNEKSEELLLKYREIIETYSTLLDKIGIKVTQMNQKIDVQTPLMERQSQHVVQRS